MFSQLLEPEGLLTDAYRGVLAERPRGYSVTANDLFAEYELGWQVLRNVRLQELAEYYAERFYLLLGRLDVLDRNPRPARSDRFGIRKDHRVGRTAGRRRGHRFDLRNVLAGDAVSPAGGAGRGEDA